MGKKYGSFGLAFLSVRMGLHSRRVPQGSSTKAKVLAALREPDDQR